MAETLITLMVFAFVFGICAAIEQARRPRMLHEDDQIGEGGVRR